MIDRLLLLACAVLFPVFAAAAPFTVDPASIKIEVAARATMHGFTGKLDSAIVTLDADASTGTISAATVRFAWADLKTGDAARDKEMLTWATAKSPEGVFLLVKLAPGATADTFTATGSLALNGQSREISFPVTITKTAAGWAVRGSTTIDHRNWGLPKIRKFGMLTVAPAVTISFALVAKPAA
ncbi:MAG: YceI family protein [Opitutaceae bacterium]|nr:YceI family protein [Opitutaceae bacterium]